MQSMHSNGTARHAVWAGCLAFFLLSGLGNAEEQTPLNRGLKILYAGRPSSDREKDFVDFLRKHFTMVETTDLKVFDESRCTGFDVTILDYDGDGFKAPRPRLSEGFSRPLLTVGVPGAIICDQWRLKTGYL